MDAVGRFVVGMHDDYKPPTVHDGVSRLSFTVNTL